MHRPRHRRATAGPPVWLLLTVLLALQISAPPASAQSDLSTAVAQLVNQARDNRGIDRLDVRGHLNDVALDHAQRMARRGTLFHNPDLADAMVGDWHSVGENVGYGPDVKTVHAAFMKSLPHRANLVDRDFTRLGTAAVRRGTHVWVVQVFLAK